MLYIMHIGTSGPCDDDDDDTRNIHMMTVKSTGLAVAELWGQGRPHNCVKL